MQTEDQKKLIEQYRNGEITEEEFIKAIDKTIKFSNNDDTSLNEVTYKKCKLVARKENVYTTDGKFMFSVSITDRAKELINNKDWNIKEENWLEYWKRTEPERELEKQKQYKFAADLVDAFNKMYGNFE